MHDVFIEAGGCHLVPLPSSRVCLLGLQTFLESSQGTIRHMPRQATSPIVINRWITLRTKSATDQRRLRKFPRDHSPTVLAPQKLPKPTISTLTRSSDQGSSVGRHSNSKSSLLVRHRSQGNDFQYIHCIHIWTFTCGALFACLIFHRDIHKAIHSGKNKSQDMQTKPKIKIHHFAGRFLLRKPVSNGWIFTHNVADKQIKQIKITQCDH